MHPRRALFLLCNAGSSAPRGPAAELQAARTRDIVQRERRERERRERKARRTKDQTQAQPLEALPLPPRARTWAARTVFAFMVGGGMG